MRNIPTTGERFMAARPFNFLAPSVLAYADPDLVARPGAHAAPASHSPTRSVMPTPTEIHRMEGAILRNSRSDREVILRNGRWVPHRGTAK
jgi:hypothetical protein